MVFALKYAKIKNKKIQNRDQQKIKHGRDWKKERTIDRCINRKENKFKN